MEKRANNFFRFLKYVKPYTHYLVLAVLGGIVKFTLPLMIPLIIGYLIDDVFLNAEMSADEKWNELLFYIGGMMLLLVTVFGPWVFVRHYFAAKAGHRSVFDLRCDLYYNILRMSTSFFSRNKSGEIISRLISDIQLTQNLVGSALTNVWMDGTAIIVIVGILLYKDVSLTFVALATFPIYIFFFHQLQGRIRSSSYQVQEEIANLSGNASEKIMGNVVVHAFTQEGREDKRFYNDSERIFSKAMLTHLFQSINMFVTGVLTNLAPLIVLMYGGYRIIHGELTVGQLVAFTLYLGPLYLPLQRLSELNVVFANSMAALDRIFEIMDQKSDIVEKNDAIELEEATGKVTFENVSFAYTPDEPVLRDISFTAEPGQRIAIVGPSGSGKSTLISMIPRFYDPTSGQILIDDHNVRDLKLNSLRQHIGMVLQDPILFSGTIRENILYGSPKADDPTLIEACKAANAWSFIQELPDKLNTEVGERGGFLSGGQKQRITIARAFLTNPRIIILDEPTSALDSESEELIQDAMERLMVGKTTFIIAHRLSTIISADSIIVLQSGKLVESGTHQELIKYKGLYQGLYQRQFQFVVAKMDQHESREASNIQVN